MSNRQLDLTTYTIVDIKKDMVQCFDDDYNGANGSEYWELSEEKDKEREYISVAEIQGFETEAARFISEIYDEETDDITNIEAILDKVEECWGSHASQFNYSVTPCKDEEGEDAYVISIAMLT